MRGMLGSLLVASVVFMGASTSRAADEMPWSFNAPRAEGYSIDLVSVEPAPGTPIKVGETVNVKVTVSYKLTATEKGGVVLVFQDEKNRSPKAEGEKQVFQQITGASGTLTLEDKITVPKRAKELRLFVPVMPDGVEETTGEVVIRWPIVKK